MAECVAASTISASGDANGWNAVKEHASAALLSSALSDELCQRAEPATQIRITCEIITTGTFLVSNASSSMSSPGTCTVMTKRKGLESLAVRVMPQYRFEPRL